MRYPIHRLRELIDRIGRRAIEREMGVHRTTITRWYDGAVQCPEGSVKLLEMLAGNYPGTCGQWEGWRFHQGELWSPEGYRFHPGDLMAQRYERMSLEAYRRELAEAKKKIAAMSVDPAVRGKAANDAVIEFVVPSEAV